MIGDFRTDALHEALGRPPIEDDMLMALLVLAFAGQNVRVDSGANDTVFGPKRFRRHAARLLSEDGKLAFDTETVRVAARSMLIDVLSCRRGMSNSGVVSRIAGDAIGADSFLPNMGSEDFLLCLSRQALEAAAKEVGILPRLRVRETRAALVDHFRQGHFVHASALFAPNPNDVADLISQADTLDDEASRADVAEDGPEVERIEGAATDAETESDTDEGNPAGESAVDKGGASDVPETFENAPDAAEPVPDDAQDAYRVAAE